ncbi:MAG: deoxyribonuclease V [Anaerolineae bacterium]
MALLPRWTHPWDVSPAEARVLQDRLRAQVVVAPLASPPRFVAGVDVSIQDEVARAAVVLLSFPDLSPVEASTAQAPVSFPYIPGLLAFREGPVVLAALERLRGQPDVLIFDAQGLAHPRRMGLATHLGILLDRPSIGCAKSRLWGEHDEPPSQRGGWVPLWDGGEVIGAVLRTQTGVQPVYVSVGHRVDLETAIDLVLACTPTYRLPEPIRWAHRVAGGETLPAARQQALF